MMLQCWKEIQEEKEDSRTIVSINMAMAYTKFMPEPDNLTMY